MPDGPSYAEQGAGWRPGRPRLRPLGLVFAWLSAALAVLAAAAVLPGASVNGFAGALVVAAIVGVLNAILPPVLAAVQMPFTVLTGFLLALALDAAMLLLAADIAPDELYVDGVGTALLVALLTSALSTAIGVIAGIDDDSYQLALARRIARRTGSPQRTDVAGLVCLEIDGLALPVLRRAIRDGVTPTMGRWLQDGSHRLVEWETDLSSQTGASLQSRCGADPFVRVTRRHPDVRDHDVGTEPLDRFEEAVEVIAGRHDLDRRRCSQYLLYALADDQAVVSEDDANGHGLDDNRAGERSRAITEPPGTARACGS